MAKRRNHAPDFKAKVALAALSGNKTVAELSTEYGVHQTQINRWVKQLKDNAPEVFQATVNQQSTVWKRISRNCTRKLVSLLLSVIFY